MASKNRWVTQTLIAASLVALLVNQEDPAPLELIPKTSTTPKAPRDVAPIATRFFKLSYVDGVVAHLEVPDDAPAATRVVIDCLRSNDPFQLSIRYVCAQLTKNDEYVFRFTARSDQPRSINCSCTMAKSPWSNYGLSQTLEIVTTWQVYEASFRSSATDSFAALTINLGSGTAAFDLKDVQLIRKAPVSTATRPPFESDLLRRFVTRKSLCLGNSMSARAKVDRRSALDSRKFPNEPRLGSQREYPSTSVSCGSAPSNLAITMKL